jgi:hypothetical protein
MFNMATSTLLAGAFAVGTALFWGTYGPLLQRGHQYMESDGRLRPFICVGVAYLLVAIVGPILVMYLTGMEMETAKGRGLFHGWSLSGILMSTLAGGVGALGAFTLIMALNYGGPRSPLFVMPIVFGCAPIVSTFFSMYLNKSLSQISPFFAAGLILVAAGAVTILVTAPKPKPKPASHGAKPAATANKDVATSKESHSERAEAKSTDSKA